MRTLAPTPEVSFGDAEQVPGLKKDKSETKRRAVGQASANTQWPFCHARCCLVFLLLLIAIRAVQWYDGFVPSGTVRFVHMFSFGADIITFFCTFPLLICGIGGVQGQCVKLGCVGPMMTMVVAMNIVDVTSLLAFFYYGARRPLPAKEEPVMDTLQLMSPVCELVLVASCALNFAVSVSVFRIYRELRVFGLYPPHATTKTPREKVSAMEVVCEAEDVALLHECGKARQEEMSNICQGFDEVVAELPDGAVYISNDERQSALASPVFARSDPDGLPPPV